MGLIRDLRVALASRRLFRNWLVAGLRYFLIMHGLAKGLITVKCGNASYGLSPSTYSLIINAHYDGYVTGFRCGDALEVFLGDAIRLVVNKDGNVLFVMPDGIRLYADYPDLTVLPETWLYDTHFLGFDLSGWLVFDVGAYVGDTPLYFARRGAFVVAVEPVPTYFNAMLRNLELNPELKSRILPINAAIADRDGYVEIGLDGEVDGEASMFKGGVKRVRVRSFTLGSLLNHIKNLGVDINSFRVRALKMDCKGCEWDVVNNELDTLKLFDVIKIEYSTYLRNYPVNELMGRVESLGFKCRRYAHNEIAVKMGLNKHGTIMCMRI
ncbi:FkbM family methyltransferase [Vulcanisaeta distributa]|uniref:FkbM family methyltransferase n=1 Tax=Vulcanisaeta distributa TaxID=164451 RepID=UPI0006D0E5E1|nr:FkbM family methyltransferase [Vulcanisaeta distributa]